MAGAGSRFSLAGYDKPKPFIDVAGKPMIVRVLENLYYPDAQYILVARKEHLDAEINLVKKIKQEFNVTFIPIKNLTEGTACTLLYARHLINNDEPLIIANSDQIVDGGIEGFVADCEKRGLDGSILTFQDWCRDPKWSFAKINSDCLVVEVKEKTPISEFATVGIYLFSRGRDFVDAAISMFIEGDRVNGEYYTCPTYNYMIREGQKIGIYNIDISAMHGVGTPEDLNKYLTVIRAK